MIARPPAASWHHTADTPGRPADASASVAMAGFITDRIGVVERRLNGPEWAGKVAHYPGSNAIPLPRRPRGVPGQLPDLRPDRGGQAPVLVADGAAGTAGEDEPVELHPEPLGGGRRVRAAVHQELAEAAGRVPEAAGRHEPRAVQDRPEVQVVVVEVPGVLWRRGAHIEVGDQPSPGPERAVQPGHHIGEVGNEDERVERGDDVVPAGAEPLVVEVDEPGLLPPAR